MEKHLTQYLIHKCSMLEGENSHLFTYGTPCFRYFGNKLMLGQIYGHGYADCFYFWDPHHQRTIKEE